MNGAFSAGSAVGYFIGLLIAAAVILPQRRLWVRKARKLALQSDIALPQPLVARAARFLRNEMVLSQFFTSLTVPLMDGFLIPIAAHESWAASLPWLLASASLYVAVACFVVSLWPRWKASGEYRITHLDRLPVRRAFTPAEYAAVNAGLVFSAALTAWGLWYVAASPLWWLGCAAALAGAVAVGRFTADRIMSRPSSASDSLELGWDDLLRFRQVRGLMIGLAWGSAALAYLIDAVASSAFVTGTPIPGGESYQFNWWPIVVPVIVIVVLYRVFRQGRRLWRQAWLDRG
jgi:hypothetical protein